MTKKRKPPVDVACFADYLDFLTRIYNWLFPPLVDKSLAFYKWYYTEKEPTQIFTSDDVKYVLSILVQEKPTDVDSLVALTGQICIADGIVLREAIRYRMSRLDGRTDKMLIARNDAVGAVRDCLQVFYDVAKQSEDKNSSDASTTKK